MVTRLPTSSGDGGEPAQYRVRRWQTARTWARLIREAEALWRVDVRSLRRLASQELFQLVQEVPVEEMQELQRD